MPVHRHPRLLFQDDTALLQNTPQRNALLDRIKGMGGQAVQADVMWGAVRKGGQYDLAAYDSLVNEARRRGLGVRFRLMGTPRYMENRPGVDLALNAENPNAHMMGVFARDIAQHFQGRVGGYSIWNEPNVGSFINQDAPIAARTYRQLYRQGYAAIKGVSPNALVGLGELTSQAPGAPGPYSTIGFLKNVLRGNKPLHADYLAVHPYQWADPTKKIGNAWYGGISNLPALQQALADAQRQHQLLTRAGGRVPLSISEYGYKQDAQTDPRVRARWLSQSYDLAQQAGVQDFNLYQLLPRAGAYWDSSIMNAQGQLDPGMAEALKSMRRSYSRPPSRPVARRARR
jgi:hypothetical protein